MSLLQVAGLLLAFILSPVYPCQAIACGIATGSQLTRAGPEWLSIYLAASRGNPRRGWP